MSSKAASRNEPADAFLETTRADVETWLTEALDSLTATTPPRLREAMAYSLLGGGKRLRALLCIAAARAVKPGSTSSLVRAAACALECVHAYSLIHDDLPAMDDDDWRRGKPTNHRVYGEAMAILAGDALLTHAFSLVAQSASAPNAAPVASDVAASASSVVAASAAALAMTRELAASAGPFGMVGGQVMDIAEDRPSDEGYLRQLHRLKTGALIRAACRMGAFAAGASAPELERLTGFGEAVGLAFQVVDDVLDATASEAELGKPVGADAAAGRFTFVALLGVEGARAEAQRLVDEALAALEGFGLEAKAPLEALAKLTVGRRS